GPRALGEAGASWCESLQPLGEPVHAELAGGAGAAEVIGRAVRGSLHGRGLKRGQLLEDGQQLAPLEQRARNARRALARRAGERCLERAVAPEEVGRGLLPYPPRTRDP